MNTDRPDHDDETGPERQTGPAAADAAGQPAADEAGASAAPDAQAEPGAQAEPAVSGAQAPSSAQAEPAVSEAPRDAEATAPVADEAPPAPAQDEAAQPGPKDTGARAAAGSGERTGPDPEPAGADGRREPGAGSGQDRVPDVSGDAGASEGGGLTTRPPRRWSPVLIASVAAAVLLVGGGGAYLASSVSGDRTASAGAGGADGSTPPPLALDGYDTGGGGDSRGIAAGEPNPYGVHYRADGDLPAGPGSAPVYRASGEVTEAEVARLAKALGLDGTPVARGESWQVGSVKDGSGPDLTVDRAAPGTWTFHRYAAGTDACGAAVTCAEDPASPAAEPVDAAAAEKAAAPVLKAIGQDGAKLDAGQVRGAQRVVNADPVVGGLPTYGWTTGLTVGASGELVGGTGRLKAPVEGASYPVLGAARTLALLNAAPEAGHRMGIGGCASAVPLKDRLEQPCGSGAGTGTGTSDVPSGGTVTVEDAVFGLALRTRQGQPLLVPSWLFQVRGADGRGVFTVAHPAVDPAYLTSPSSPSSPSAAPSASGSAGPRDVEVDGYTAEGRELTVGFTGGVCADYTATAEESAGAVTVKVTERPWKGTVCVMIAKEMRQKVTLDAPLGGRKVVGTGGEGVAPLKAGARLPEASDAR
ncbi:hypothetical protein [Streptomyces sp. MAA16]|uniref:hypothetical protein n=1 Tax=Streptomyces sp. MAA16 TaxID=3035116 RepID=UPI002474B1AC|nr:hypothetical protein [Streptomyces sp. MAA16]MDH6698114.1 hypothetical protein [Streptomyces sp. MAA16]